MTEVTDPGRKDSDTGTVTIDCDDCAVREVRQMNSL